jgi:hypothetical protein
VCDVWLCECRRVRSCSNSSPFLRKYVGKLQEREVRVGTVRLTSIHNPVSEYQEFQPQPHSDIVGPIEKIG